MPEKTPPEHAHSVASSLPNGKLLLSIAGFSGFLALQTYYGLSFALPLSFSYETEFAILLRMASIFAVVVFVTLGSRFSRFIMDQGRFALVAISSLGCIPFAYELIALLLGARIEWLAVPLWMLFGISYGALALIWGMILSQNNFHQNITTLASSGLISVFLYLSTSSIKPFELSLFGTLTILVACVLLSSILVKRLSSFGDWMADDQPDEAPTIDLPEKIWTALINVAYGLILVVGGTQSLAAALVIGASGAIGSILSVLAGRLPATAMPTSRQVQMAALPIIVTALLLLPHLSGPSLVVCAAVAVMAHSFANLLQWCEASDACLEFRIDPIRQYAQGTLSKWIGMLAGTAAGLCLFVSPLFTGEQVELCLILFVFVLLVSFVLFTVHGEHHAEELNQKLLDAVSVPENPDRTFALACEEVAARHNLSPREAEILTLLARGRNAKYLEEHLYISLSTARSHIYHIYRKLNVSSQQTLIDLVDQSRHRKNP